MYPLNPLLYAPIVPGQETTGSITGLVLYISIALGFSFLCSLLEAALLSSSPSHVEVLAQANRKAGHLMKKYKANVERPISAILTLNTIAHTVGAAGAGAEAAALFGNQYIGIISAILTLLILVLSEIIPKTLGAVYWKQLTPFTAYTIQVMMISLYPAVWFFEKLTTLLRPSDEDVTVTRADLQALARIGTKEGILLEQENRVLRNLLQLDKVQVETIMTPRTVITALQEDITVQEVLENHDSIPYSRIPVYGKDMDDIERYLLYSQFLEQAALDNHDTQIKELAQKIQTIPETETVMDVLNGFILQKEHIFLVIDEYGGTAGIVTMEDALEALLGMEITDESDVVEDLRTLAEERYRQRMAEWETTKQFKMLDSTPSE